MQGYQLLAIVILGASFLIQMMLKSKMDKYSKIVNPLRLTGKDIAEQMLRDSGIYDVRIISTAGQLTDHYNPIDKTVNLSELVYNANSITSAAVSAHEVGHAIQHAKGYSMLQFRSKLVPIVSFTSKIMPIVLMAGFAMLAMGIVLPLVLGILLYASTTLFALVTLPVEFDASRRAVEWLNTKGISGEYNDMVRDGLKWAALTYVANALASIVNLLYYFSLLISRRNN